MFTYGRELIGKDLKELTRVIEMSCILILVVLKWCIYLSKLIVCLNLFFRYILAHKTEKGQNQERARENVCFG